MGRPHKDKKSAEKEANSMDAYGNTKEEVELTEKGTAYPATVDTLRKIVKDKQHQTVMFDKGQALVDLFTASAMVQVYDALKPATKKKFEDMIKSKEGFMKSQAFAMKMAK